MEKLTLKEIAGYLPYSLEFIYNNDSPVEKNKWLLVSLGKRQNGNDFFAKAEREDYKNQINTTISLIKPLLYPLEMLTKTIVHNGVEIIPMIEMIKELSLYNLSKCEFELSGFEDDIFYVNAHDGGRVIDWLSFDGNIFELDGKTLNPQYEAFELLNKYHFDWKYDLIISGKAIDKSTLNSK